MDEKKVVIYLNSAQVYGGDAPSYTELVTEGTLSVAGDGEIVLSYNETELTGMEGTVTRFRIRDGLVILERAGTVNSQMLFQKGNPCCTLYETPWGTATVDITTSYFDCRIGERGGFMKLRYAVSIEGQFIGETTVHIRVKETREELPI